MKWLFVVFAVLATAFAEEVCYEKMEAACSTKPSSESDVLSNCNAKYGEFAAVNSFLETDLQAYAMAHIETNFNFLIMSSYFGNFETNREGFKSLYRKLSDDAWEKGINIMKYIAKRGGKMNFGQVAESHGKRNVKSNNIFELSEMSSLAKGLDMTKKLAEEALRIHTQSMHHSKDAAVGHYLEEEFMEYQTDTVRTLSGYTTELRKLLSGKNKEKDSSLSLYLFDQYLKQIM